jgi:hypothetical protein
MLTNEPILTELVSQLQQLRQELMAQPLARREIKFSRAHLEMARVAFAEVILHGEESLHRLCELFCDTFFTAHQLQSIVVGEIATTKERFTLTQPIPHKDLYTTTDTDLGHRQLKKLQFKDGERWSTANLVANFVEYQPLEPNSYNIHKLVSRIKAEQEIWNKVVDEIFGLDHLVARDKELRMLGRYVKDIFGIKIVVGEVDDIYRVQNSLIELIWPDVMLEKVGIEPLDLTKQLSFMEVKDYLAHSRSKLTGWEAVKSVVHWSGKTFEIQVQTLRNFLREREFLTRESHMSFRANREKVREQVAGQIPLFGFYQELLRWLFLYPDTPPPTHKRVILRLVD